MAEEKWPRRRRQQEEDIVVPDFPSSFPPSPYIVNHKRRGPHRLLHKSLSHNDVVVGAARAVGCPPSPPTTDAMKVEDQIISNHVDPISAAPTPPNGNPHRIDHVVVLADEGSGDPAAVVSPAAVFPVVVENSERDAAATAECEDFFDPQDSISILSSSNTEVDESCGPDRSWKPSTPMGEYFDAFEEISSEGATQFSLQNIEAELREMRLNLLMEIEKRKQAEEALDNLQSLWQMMSNQLSLVGLALPAAPSIADDIDGVSDIDDPVDELHHQVLVARFVAGSVGRGCTKAEVALEMEPQINSKNFEIARLCDRLQYYEAANREMSQRNQEVVEMARQNRQRRKRRQKWLWRSIGLTVTLGSVALAWSYFSISSEPQSLEDVREAADELD